MFIDRREWPLKEQKVIDDNDNDYNNYNDYNDYNDCNDYNNYRDSNLDLDWERFSELVI